MTSPEVLKLKMITAMIESLEDADDEEEAKQALKLIKTLLGEK
jgi:hypothetical protein